MARKLQEHELRDLFQENLPPVLVPPELAAQLRQRVLAEVETKLQTSSEKSVDLTRSTDEGPVEKFPIPVKRSTPARQHRAWAGFLDALNARFGSLRLASSFVVASATVAALVIFVAMLPRLLPEILNSEPQTSAQLQELPALDIIEPVLSESTVFESAVSDSTAPESIALSITSESTVTPVTASARNEDDLAQADRASGDVETIASGAETLLAAEDEALAALPQDEAPTAEAEAIAMAVILTPTELPTAAPTKTGEPTATKRPVTDDTADSARVMALLPTATPTSSPTARPKQTRTDDGRPAEATTLSSPSPTPQPKATTAAVSTPLAGLAAAIKPTALKTASPTATTATTSASIKTRTAPLSPTSTQAATKSPLTPTTVIMAAGLRDTATPTRKPTRTPLPTATASSTPRPTATPTQTPLPTATSTDIPPTPTATATRPIIFVNRPPFAEDDSRTLLEDKAFTIPALANDSDPDGENPFIISVEKPLHGSASVSPAGSTVVYTPALDFVGTDQFSYTISDGMLTASATVTILVDPVNDAPSFTLATQQVTVEEDAGAHFVAAFASEASSGPADESSQTLRFELEVGDESIFAELPAINATSGDLTFAAAPDANGTTQVSVVLVDDGGTENQGVNRSDAQTFDIEISAKDDVPTFSLRQQEIVVDEDAGAQIVPDLVTNISAGAADERGQALRFAVQVDNQALFAELPVLDTDSGDLTFTPAKDEFGEAQVTAVLVDDGGQRSSAAQFTIRVNSVNDAPSFGLSENAIVVDEDTGSQQQRTWAADLSAGAANENNQALSFDVIVDNSELFETVPNIDAVTGDLRFTTLADQHGTATVTARLRDDGGQISEEKTFVITVQPVNDLPQAIDDRFETDQNSAVSGNILAANPETPDSDADGDMLAIVGINGNSLPDEMPVELPSGAKLILNRDGSFEYSPDSKFVGLPDGDTAEDRFVYRLDDGSGQGLQEATVTIIISGLNDTPVAGEDRYELGDAETITGDLLSSDGNGPEATDPDGDLLSVTAINGTPLTETDTVTLASGAVVTIQSNGTFVYRRVAGSTAATEDVFNYTVSDTHGASAEGAVKIQS